MLSRVRPGCQWNEDVTEEAELAQLRGVGDRESRIQAAAVSASVPLRRYSLSVVIVATVIRRLQEVVECKSEEINSSPPGWLPVPETI